MVDLIGNKDIGEKVEIIANLAEANELKGVIDQTDFNDPEKLGKGQEMVDRLSNLISSSTPRNSTSAPTELKETTS